jgi:RimJ/RimL family protein N-acetyltransferase
LEVAGGQIVDLYATSGAGVQVDTVLLALDQLLEILAAESVKAVHLLTPAGDEPVLRAASIKGFTIGEPVPHRLVVDGALVTGWTGSVNLSLRPARGSRWLDPAVIETRDAVLRPMRISDALRIAEGCGDPVSSHWMGRMPHPFTIDSAVEAVHDATILAARGRRYTWAVADPATDLLMGQVVLTGVHVHRGTSCEIGYWLHPDARGRGLMVQVVHALLNHAKARLGLDRIWLITSTSNVASNATAERTGFTRVGTQRGLVHLGDGSFADGNVYERCL